MDKSILEQIEEYCHKRCLVLITADLYDKLTHHSFKTATAQPERSTGKWIQETKHYKDSEQEFYYYEERCSECGTKRKIGWADVRYCPMCGARMVKEGEEHGQNT